MTKQVDFITVGPADTMAVTSVPALEVQGGELTLLEAPTIDPAPDTLTSWVQWIVVEDVDDLVEVESSEDADQVYGADEFVRDDWAWEPVPGTLPLPLPNLPLVLSVAYKAEKAGYEDLVFRSAAVFQRPFQALNPSQFTVASTQVPVGDGAVLSGNPEIVEFDPPATGTQLRAFYVRADGSEVEILPPPPPTVQEIARVGSWVGASSNTVALPVSEELGLAFVVATGVGLDVSDQEEEGWTILAEHTAENFDRRFLVAAKIMAPGEQIGTWGSANRIAAGLFTGVQALFDGSGKLTFEMDFQKEPGGNITYPDFPAEGTLPTGSRILIFQTNLGSTEPLPENSQLTTQITVATNNRLRVMEGAVTSITEEATAIALSQDMVLTLALKPAAGA